MRTSTQCWCDDNDDCLANPAVRALTDRMMNVTRLPYNNAEYFQILRYEPGQASSRAPCASCVPPRPVRGVTAGSLAPFYRQHHDQQTAHWTPQGVRVYTFFVYLSDVEEGGARALVVVEEAPRGAHAQRVPAGVGFAAVGVTRRAPPIRANRARPRARPARTRR